MCEFKIIRRNDGSQIGEDVLVLSYTEDNELIFKDVLGMGEKLESALILDVNTLNKTATIVEHPLIKEFLRIILNTNNNDALKSDIEDFQDQLEKLKNSV